MATKGRVTCFSGPKEGAGSTTLALNLALAWAGSSTRSVIIVQFDPLCRDELGSSLGLRVDPPPLSRYIALNPRALRGRLLSEVEVSTWGVGVMPLADGPDEARRVTPAAALRVLRALNEFHDIFLDVDPCSPLRETALAAADTVLWTCRPSRAHLEATLRAFQKFRQRRVPLGRLGFVVNDCDGAGSLSAAEVSDFCAALSAPLISSMPREDLLPQFANKGKVLIAQELLSPWVKALRPVLGHLTMLH